ncbi:hypothetical protein GM418_30430 [Maribellus comscasis]|uniref:Sialidase domain-containing protein n=1 Tax=Maribellus comscasis TaxID=2681766 RepID=A0A6I6K2Z1_9BACT|nr:sialidase family protein [Maribellus comscasis]QGY47818.1 hypothetical protein GM418_30430 [Maribellus comscasis]
MKPRPFIILFFIQLCFVFSLNAQNPDWRNAKNGSSIYTNGYCDQPYVVVLENGKWLCVFTTNEGREGTGGQHIVSCISEDQGKTWSDTVRIESPGKESASWAMPYLTSYGRVFVFYDYNGDKIHQLGDRKNIREDMLGWYCYKYSDDEGISWSKRYRLDVRKTPVDLNNNWSGKVQIMWGIGKPVDVDNGMMFAFTKIGQYSAHNSEGWFFRCDNIHSEKNPQKLKWKMLPEGEYGLKNPSLGPINSEQNIFQLNNGSIYCMYRTISGYPAESYSTDGGKNWTLPQPPEYENGFKLKNPRACPRIWKCKNGKYLFWYHNHGGWNFNSRNPAWISGGIERKGKIIWSQPEILIYEENIDTRMSYPDLIEQDRKYWVSETNKEDARCHAIPDGFFDKIWSQFDRKTVTTESLLGEWSENDLEVGRKLSIPYEDSSQFQTGFTIDFRIELSNLVSGQPVLIVQSKNGKIVELQSGEFGAIQIVINDGNQTTKWNSDPGLIKAFGENCVSVSIDNGSKIIQFVVNGTVCNGRNFRQYGWTHFKPKMEDIDFNNIEIGKFERGQGVNFGTKLTHMRIYNRPLMNSELIGNHRNFLGKELFLNLNSKEN